MGGGSYDSTLADSQMSMIVTEEQPEALPAALLADTDFRAAAFFTSPMSTCLRIHRWF